jgi:hypothetical protein
MTFASNYVLLDMQTGGVRQLVHHIPLFKVEDEFIGNKNMEKVSHVHVAQVTLACMCSIIRPLSTSTVHITARRPQIRNALPTIGKNEEASGLTVQSANRYKAHCLRVAHEIHDGAPPALIVDRTYVPLGLM